MLEAGYLVSVERSVVGLNQGPKELRSRRCDVQHTSSVASRLSIRRNSRSEYVGKSARESIKNHEVNHSPAVISTACWGKKRKKKKRERGEKNAIVYFFFLIVHPYTFRKTKFANVGRGLSQSKTIV